MSLMRVRHSCYGEFQLVGEPFDPEGCTWGVAVWDGEHVSYVSPECLTPLDRGARLMLGEYTEAGYRRRARQRSRLFGLMLISAVAGAKAIRELPL